MRSLVKPPVPFDDELLSSFLARATAISGVSLHTFCVRIAGQIPVWTRDIDRTAPEQLLTQVASRLLLDRDQLCRLTLHNEERILSGQLARKGTGALLLAVGVRHRDRMLHGQQYCPACLDESPYFKKRWRLAFAVSCGRHDLALRDACFACGAGINIHRAHRDLRRCWHCKRRLSIGPREASTTNDLVRQLVVKLDALLEPGASLDHSTAEFVRFRALIKERRGRIVQSASGSRRSASAFEHLRVWDRLAILRETAPWFLAGVVPRPSTVARRVATKKLERDPLEQLLRAKGRMTFSDYATKRARLILTAAGLSDELD